MSNVLLISENGKSLVASNTVIQVMTVSKKNIAGSGGVGAVSSVNTKVGAVVISPDDLDDTGTTNKFTSQTEIDKLSDIEDNATADQTALEIESSYESQPDTNKFTDAEKTLLSNQSGANTGDQDITGITNNANAITALDTAKQDSISGDTITSATVATGDKVLIQDVSDSDNLKVVTAQSIADLGGGSSSGAQYEMQYSDGAGGFSATNALKTDASGNIISTANMTGYQHGTTGVVNSGFWLGSAGSGSTSAVFWKLTGSAACYLQARLGCTFASDTGLLFRKISGTADVGLIYSSTNTLQVINGSGGTGYLIYNNPNITKTDDYTTTAQDRTVSFNKATAVTGTLVTAVGNRGLRQTIKNRGVGVLTVNTSSSQLIDDDLTWTLNKNEWLIVESNGTNWEVVG